MAAEDKALEAGKPKGDGVAPSKQQPSIPRGVFPRGPAEIPPGEWVEWLAEDGKRYRTMNHARTNEAGILVPTGTFTTVKVKPTTYTEVVFASRTDPNQTEQVTLSLNGECLVMQRRVKVILPTDFLTGPAEGGYDEFEQKPGKDRKVSGHVKYYPYTVIRENVPESEYREFRAKCFNIERQAQVKREAAVEAA